MSVVVSSGTGATINVMDSDEDDLELDEDIVLTTASWMAELCSSNVEDVVVLMDFFENPSLTSDVVISGTNLAHVPTGTF